MTNALVKICGITTVDDARLALDLGADVLGFNFYEPSVRYIDPEPAGRILSELPDDTVSAGIFVDASLERIREVLQACPLTMVQLHGAEDNVFCQQVKSLGAEVIKAFRIRRPEDIDQVAGFDVDAVLLDAFHEKLYGGTGHVFDWSWIDRAQHERVFLAGGLTPDNITDALAVGTYAVDLCSGVEGEPGRKDPEKMKMLFQRIQAYYA